MLQLAINIGLSTLILFFLARLLPGLEIEHIYDAIFACLFIGFLNFLIAPILFILRMPVNAATIFIFSLVVNILLLNVAMGLIDEFDSSSWSAAILGAIILSVVQIVSNALTEDRRKLLG